GGSGLLSSSAQKRTLDTWPVIFEQDETMNEKIYTRRIEQRKLLVELMRQYVDTLCFEGPEGIRRGICLCGLPGVGKTGLIRSIEPLLAERGHFMLSLFI